jgi:DNA helicase-2/ATP-dependent DNA helicase PcrA
MKMAAVQQVEWLAGLFEHTADFVRFMDQLNEGVKLGQRRLMTKDSSVDALVLSTIHQCKGLQWPAVFMCDVVNGRHPWSKAFSLAEELRLGYVGFTRAERLVTVTYSREGAGVDSFIVKKLRDHVVRLTAIRNDEETQPPSSQG